MYISENFSLQSSSIRTNSANAEQDTIKLVYNHQITYTYQPSAYRFSSQPLAAWTLAVTSGANVAAGRCGHSHGERMHCDSGIDVEKLSIDASKCDTCGWVAGASWLASKASSLIA